MKPRFSRRRNREHKYANCGEQPCDYGNDRGGDTDPTKGNPESERCQRQPAPAWLKSSAETWRRFKAAKKA
jgi:hypothetical protein